MADLARMFGATEGDTFLGLPPWDGGPAPAVLLGADGCTPYPSVGFYCAGGAGAIRRASRALAASHAHHNFDTGLPVLGHPPPADAGDLPVREDAPGANRDLLRARVSDILAQGATPVLLGGDDSLPTPMLQALPGPLTVLQIDAHIDWREEVEGERWGLSSTMRRASELPQVERIVQVGQRGVGSARPQDVRDALDWGVHFVPASDPDPVAAALAQVPPGAPVAFCLDWDALDPSQMPAVIGRAAGGLAFAQALRLLLGVHAKARLAALAFTEFMPQRDVDGLGATLAAQLVTAALGLLSAPKLAPPGPAG